MENSERKKEEATEKNKAFIIIVNAREKMWTEKTINFEQVIILAFGIFENTQSTAYTITYSRGEGEKSGGSMVIGDSIHVKDKMIFNVTQTNRS